MASKRREIFVNLHLSHRMTIHDAALRRWLSRCEHPMKKGASICFKYAVVEDVIPRSYALHQGFARHGDNCGAKGKIEALKIRTALRKAARKFGTPRFENVDFRERC